MLKKAGVLSLGALVAQSITFLALPALTRIYGPVEYGKYSVLLAFAMMLTPLATLKLETLIVVEKNERAAALYLRIAIYITLSISFLILIINLAIALISQFVKTMNFYWYWLFLPLLIIINVTVLLSQQITLREKAFKSFSLTGIFQSIFVALFQICLCSVLPKTVSLFLGLFLGKISGISWIYPRTKKLWTIHRKGSNTYFRKLRQVYPQVKLLNQGSLFEAIAVAFPTVYVGIFFGNQSAGIFSLSHVLLMAPIVLLGSGIGSLILSEFREGSEQSGNEIKIQTTEIRKVFYFLIGASILYVIFNFFFSGFLVEELMGPKWTPAAELFTIIGFPYSVGLIWYPLVNLFWSKQDWINYRNFSFIRMILPIAFAIISNILTDDWKTTICFISWGTAISQLIGIYMLNSKWKFFRISYRKQAL